MAGLTDDTPARPILPGKHQKHEVSLLFTPPVLFYRRPDDLNRGIVETLAEMPEASIAIDPLCGQDWGDFIRACRVRGRTVYGWTRVYNWDNLPRFVDAAQDAGLDQHWFSNIEDDDLRGVRPSEFRELFLKHVARTGTPIGVLTNYFVSPEWPEDHPLGHLPVLPEWFPREITDPTATLEGSLDSGRAHFAAAVPLLDGREERGLAAFPYPAGAFSVWPADNVTDWSVWKR